LKGEELVDFMSSLLFSTIFLGHGFSSLGILMALFGAVRSPVLTGLGVAEGIMLLLGANLTTGVANGVLATTLGERKH
jgi:hypothetical protein